MNDASVFTGENVHCSMMILYSVVSKCYSIDDTGK